MTPARPTAQPAGGLLVEGVRGLVVFAIFCGVFAAASGSAGPGWAVAIAAGVLLGAWAGRLSAVGLAVAAAVLAAGYLRRGRWSIDLELVVLIGTAGGVALRAFIGVQARRVRRRRVRRVVALRSGSR